MEDEEIKKEKIEDEREELERMVIIRGPSQRGFGSLLKAVVVLVMSTMTVDNIKEEINNFNTNPYLLSSISDLDLSVNYNPKFSKLKELSILKNKVLFKTKVTTKNYIKQHNTKVKSYLKPTRNREF